MSGPRGFASGAIDDGGVEEGLGFGQATLVVHVEGEQGLAFDHEIAHLLVQDEAHRGIDVAVDRLAPRPQQHGGLAHGPTADAADAAVVRGAEGHLFGGLRKQRQVAAHRGVAALRPR